MDTICHNNLAYLSSINLIMFITFVYCVYVMLDEYFLYDQDLKNVMCFFCAMTSFLLFYVLSIYNKLLSCNTHYILVYKFLLLINASVLLYFGFITIHVNEIIDKEDQDSYDYLLAKDKNDFISIVAILFGTMSCVLILCS